LAEVVHAQRLSPRRFGLAVCHGLRDEPEDTTSPPPVASPIGPSGEARLVVADDPWTSLGVVVEGARAALALSTPEALALARRIEERGSDVVFEGAPDDAAIVRDVFLGPALAAGDPLLVTVVREADVSSRGAGGPRGASSPR
jgi:hypothetical protein